VPGIPAPLPGWPDVQITVADGLFGVLFFKKMPTTDDVIFSSTRPIREWVGHASVMPEIWNIYMQSITLINKLYSVVKDAVHVDTFDDHLMQFGDPVDMSVLGSTHSVACYNIRPDQESAFKRSLAAVPDLKETARGQIWQSERRLILWQPFGFNLTISSFSRADGVEWNGVYYYASCEYDNSEFFQGWFYQAREWVLALEPLNLPGYVLLWILETYRAELCLVELGIIEMITGVIKSCRNVRAKRLVSASAALKRK
jgi:hypothetical protein